MAEQKKTDAEESSTTPADQTEPADESAANQASAAASDCESVGQSTEEDVEPSEADVEQAERKELEPTEIEMLKAEVEQLTSKLIDAEARINDVQKNVDYAKAETHTAIRRGREDAARSVNRAKREIMNRLIDVADTFHQTTAQLENVESDDRTKVIIEAVQMAIKQFDKTLNGEGLEMVNPVGETFDPAHHEAQATVPTKEHEVGTIIDVLRVGYSMNGTPLRYPQVVVAAEVKEAAPEAEDEA